MHKLQRDWTLWLINPECFPPQLALFWLLKKWLLSFSSYPFCCHLLLFLPRLSPTFLLPLQASLPFTSACPTLPTILCLLSLSLVDGSYALLLIVNLLVLVVLFFFFFFHLLFFLSHLFLLFLPSTVSATLLVASIVQWHNVFNALILLSFSWLYMTWSLYRTCCCKIYRGVWNLQL